MQMAEPIILDRSNHNISRRNIDPNALKVMYRLYNHGYVTYLVGGSVRDLFCGRAPKDFDVGTTARPEEIRKLFKNSRIIGRRFKLVHVIFKGRKIIEVSTFRTKGAFDPEEADGSPVEENTYGTPEDDALRRDLTINGLFYNVGTFSVIDYVGGLPDLKAGIIRCIGDPYIRFKEDPVRMIRAVRHAARMNFTIEPITYKAIQDNAPLLVKCSRARIKDEFLRDLKGGAAGPSIELLIEAGILCTLFPEVEQLCSTNSADAAALRFAMIKNFCVVDRAVKSGKELRDYMLVASFFSPIMAAMKLENNLPEGKAGISTLNSMIRSRVCEMCSRFGFGKKDASDIAHTIFGCRMLALAAKKGNIPNSLKRKAYFEPALFLYQIETMAKGLRVPSVIMHQIRARNVFLIPKPKQKSNFLHQ